MQVVGRFEKQLKQTLHQLQSEQQRSTNACLEKDRQVRSTDACLEKGRQVRSTNACLEIDRQVRSVDLCEHNTSMRRILSRLLKQIPLFYRVIQNLTQ